MFGHSRVSRIDAILFDFDGFLCDSTRAVEQAWRRWAAENGAPADPILSSVHGRPARETVAHFLPALDAVAEAARIAAYEAEFNGDVGLVRGALDCVDRASRRGAWGVVTSGIRELTLARMQLIGIPEPGVLVTADDIARGKPDPEPYLKAAAALRVPPSQCLVIEDAPAGVTAATRAGMSVFAVATSHAPEELDAASRVFPDMRQVADALDRLAP